MVSAIFFTLTMLGLIPVLEKGGEELDAATNKRIQQHMEEMQERMMQVLLEMEQRDKEYSWAHAGALLLSALQHWQFWALTGALALFFVLCLMLRKLCRQMGSRNEQGISRSEEDDEEEDPNDIMDARRFDNEYMQWPVVNLENRCKVVEELVDNLLCACQTLPRKKFMPQLQPAIGVGSTLSPPENDVVYRLLVPLSPPPGHTFHLEMGTEGETPVRNSCLRVELECMCTRERLVGDMVCFLHRSEDELKNQDPTLLDTLCAGSYLDMQKTAKWFQELVKEAWAATPQSSKLQLTVLPSTRFCKIQLTNAFNETLSIEMMLGVQQDNPDTFLSFE